MTSVAQVITRPGFIETAEHRRFADFCDACRRYRYIGLCYGVPGVGKTLSARTYADWRRVEHFVFSGATYVDRVPTAVSRCRTLFYTPPVVNSPARIASELEHLRNVLAWLASVAQTKPGHALPVTPQDQTELVVIDEVDRLKMASLEQVRDLYDQSPWGLVLLGMPGIERRLSRYPQLYSRVGFVHQFRTLNSDEVRAIVTHHTDELGVTLSADAFANAAGVAAIIRACNGNFRLLQRLLQQIERVLELNELTGVTPEVVVAARESLVIGAN
jgi:DNA transposition AAA+ family ATPase